MKAIRKYALVSLLTSFGGFLFGYVAHSVSQECLQLTSRRMDTGIIGPVTVMAAYIEQFGTQSAIVHGAIVSSILIPAAISGFLAGFVADKLGRPKCIGIGALIFGLGAALQAGAVSLAMFVVGRCIEGFGEGLYLGTLVVYICEITPPNHRGPLTTEPQLLLTLGLLTGYFTCYGTARLQTSFSWRTPFLILAILSILFALLATLSLPQSPRWLALRGKYSEALAVWNTLDVDEADRERLTAIQTQEESRQADTSKREKHETHHKDGTSNGRGETKFFELFSSNVRARAIMAVFIMSMQQLSGIDGILYYAPLIFQQAGIDSSESSFLASGVSAIVILVATIPATIFADKWGRRTSMILGGLSMGIAMLLIGVLYATGTVHTSEGAGRWVVIVAVYIYVVLYCVSWSVSCKVYAAEVQPQRTRASATNLAHGANWITNFVVALTTPVLLDRSNSAAYFLWAGCLLLTAIVCAIFMPETKGKSLEDIETAFEEQTLGRQAIQKMQKLMTGIKSL